MTGKTALVTGANGGLGTHVTKALLDAGFAVVGLAPKILASDFDHPDFTALPAALDSLDAAKKAPTRSSLGAAGIGRQPDRLARQ
jgi:NAD(P)-dependent dehydrogenase (short-subunit alcohol dehydrogenase family)